MPITDFRIESLTFSGGQEFILHRGTTLLLVGPNNSGKSAALREIATCLARDHERVPSQVLSSIKFQDIAASVLLEFAKTAYAHKELKPESYSFKINAGEWVNLNRSSNKDLLCQFFYAALIQKLDTETRLAFTKPVSRIDVYADEAVPTAAIHRLQRDESSFRQVNSVVRAAFGVDLVINWGGGPTVGFHIGDAPVSTAVHDRVSQQYLEQLNQVPRLELSGDGVRSFVASTIAAHVGSHRVLLIDEPEAFLHPPQSMRLGKVISRITEDHDRQAIIATHSADFVRGAINGSNRVAICRIERKGSVNNMSALGAEDMQTLFSSPLLRSANAINGLFHEGVVICEGDADARFYEAIFTCIESELDRPLDLYFVHGGGKGALATLASTYRRLSVPAVVVADIDLLKGQNEFEAVYSALGGNPEVVKSQLSRIVGVLRDQGSVLPFADFIDRLKVVVATIDREKAISPRFKSEALELFDNASDWSEAKKYGLDKLRGEARTSVKAFMDECTKAGLFLLPVGELEGWWRDGPARKREWTPKAIERLASNRAEFAAAQDFARAVCKHFGFELTNAARPTS